MHSSPPTYYIVFTAVTALGVLLQAFVLLAIYFGIRKSTVKLHGVADEVRTQALPLIASTRSLIEDISPKLKVAVSNLAEVSHTLRHQADHVNETVEDLLDKTEAQISRVDAIVTGALDAVDHATQVMENAVSTPVRRVAGVINGIKTGVKVLVGLEKHSSSVENYSAYVAEPKASDLEDPAQTIQPPPTTSAAS